MDEDENVPPATENEIHKHLLIGVLQMVYKKHYMGDDSIGSDELDDQICGVLSEVMGMEEYNDWHMWMHQWYA
jgi:hypothetical protein